MPTFFIDDTFDVSMAFSLYRSDNSLLCFAAIAFIDFLGPKGFTWIAADGIDWPKEWDSFIPKFDGHYSVKFLKTVMRCSKNIFTAAYGEMNKYWQNAMEPLLGHKIQGLAISAPIMKPCLTKEEAISTLFEELL